jgi:hypothetical protein
MLRWRTVRRVRYLPGKYTIMLRGSPLESIAVFCDETNYERISEYIQQRVPA